MNSLEIKRDVLKHEAELSAAYYGAMSFDNQSFQQLVGDVLNFMARKNQDDLKEELKIDLVRENVKAAEIDAKRGKPAEPLIIRCGDLPFELAAKLAILDGQQLDRFVQEAKHRIFFNCETPENVAALIQRQGWSVQVVRDSVPPRPEPEPFLDVQAVNFCKREFLPALYKVQDGKLHLWWNRANIPLKYPSRALTSFSNALTNSGNKTLLVELADLPKEVRQKFNALDDGQKILFAKMALSLISESWFSQTDPNAAQIGYDERSRKQALDNGWNLQIDGGP